MVMVEVFTVMVEVFIVMVVVLWVVLLLTSTKTTLLPLTLLMTNFMLCVMYFDP